MWGLCKTSNGQSLVAILWRLVGISTVRSCSFVDLQSEYPVMVLVVVYEIEMQQGNLMHLLKVVTTRH